MSLHGQIFTRFLFDLNDLFFGLLRSTNFLITNADNKLTQVLVHRIGWTHDGPDVTYFEERVYETQTILTMSMSANTICTCCD